MVAYFGPKMRFQHYFRFKSSFWAPLDLVWTLVKLQMTEGKCLTEGYLAMDMIWEFLGRFSLYFLYFLSLGIQNSDVKRSPPLFRMDGLFIGKNPGLGTRAAWPM